jgi:hypothetical protein
MSSGYLREMLADERQLRAAYEAFFERSGDLAGAEQLRRLCRRGLAERGIWRGYRALRERRIDDAFTCLRFAVSAWHGERENEIPITWSNVLAPMGHALRERHRRHRRRRSAASLVGA